VTIEGRRVEKAIDISDVGRRATRKWEIDRNAIAVSSAKSGDLSGGRGDDHVRETCLNGKSSAAKKRRDSSSLTHPCDEPFTSLLEGKIWER